MNKEPSLELRAVIAAAVHVAIGSNARIASVEQSRQVVATNPNPQMIAWSLEGRRQIHSGHKVR